MEEFGALNTKGFSSQIEYGALPEPTHLPYEGVFNEIKFDVGKVPQLPLDLQLGYARYQFLGSTHDKNINDFLAIFVKGNKDGKDRDDRILNATICLDISGSMGSGLTFDSGSRLKLAIEAIRMFVSKLRPDDSFGLVVFDDKADVVISQTKVANLDFSKTFSILDTINTRGGTTIREGFVTSHKILYDYATDNKCTNSQNRIIMLTDVCDNSLGNEKDFIEKASSETGTTLTIVGISDEFKSDVCESLKNVKGFNYFCAVQKDDIKKYVFENFNFAYFPSAFNLDISIETEDLKSFRVYGSTDSKDVDAYNHNFATEKARKVITRMKSSFPSEIQIIDNRVHNYGGLILIKLQKKSKNPFFNGTIYLEYDDCAGKHHKQQYILKYEFHPEEQFFSDEPLRTALEAYTFVSQIRLLLEKNQNCQNKRQMYDEFWQMIQQVEILVPQSKLKDLQKVKKILKSYESQEEMAKWKSEGDYMMYG